MYRTISKLLLTISVLSFLSCNQTINNDDIYVKSPTEIKNITGSYVVKNDPSTLHSCDLKIDITHKNKKYFYTLKSKKRTINGELNLQMDAKSQNTFLVFKGIEWENYDDRYFEKTPTTIEVILENNELVIQNYGNAMNEYLKLKDCNHKYIKFKKVKH